MWHLRFPKGNRVIFVLYQYMNFLFFSIIFSIHGDNVRLLLKLIHWIICQIIRSLRSTKIKITIWTVSKVNYFIEKVKRLIALTYVWTKNTRKTQFSGVTLITEYSSKMDVIYICLIIATLFTSGHGERASMFEAHCLYFTCFSPFFVLLRARVIYI